MVQVGPQNVSQCSCRLADSDASTRAYRGHQTCEPGHTFVSGHPDPKGTCRWAEGTHGHKHTAPCREKMPRALVRVAGGQTARVAVPSLGSGWSPLQSPGWLRCIGAISGSQVGPHTQEINLGSRSAPPGCYSGRGLSSRLLCLPCPGAHPERVARRRSGPGHCC